MSFSRVNLIKRLYQTREVFRLTPFDVSTEGGRSKERYRRVVLTAAGSLAAKAIAALTMIVSVPLTVNYLGTERFGLWMTISSVIAMLSFADLGIGNGLVNSIADSNGRGDYLAVGRFVSSAFFMLLGVAILGLTLFSIVYAIASWPRIFNISSEIAIREAGPALIVFVFCFALNIPLGVVERVQQGFQEGFTNSLWQSLGSLGGLGAVLLAVRFRAGLPWLVLAMAGTPVLAMMLNGIVLFFWRRPWLRPRWDQMDRQTGSNLANLGALFFILQILTVVGSTSDNLIIAQIFGASAVAGYAVVQKLFSVALLSQYFVAPLWPAYGEALAREDYSWAKNTLHRSVLVSVALGIFFAALLIAFGQRIVFYWVGAHLVPSLTLLSGFACYAILGGYSGAMATFLNHGSLLRRQVVFYSIASIAALIMKIFLAFNWQVAGVVWATVLAYGLFYAVPSWVIAHQYLNRAFEASDVA